MTPRLPLAIAAAAAPSLLAYNISPSPTFLNQALALALWGWFVVAVGARDSGRGGGAAALQAALALVLGAVGWSWAGSLPMGLALSAIGMIAAAMVLAAAGAGAHSRPDAGAAFGDFCVGWAVTGAFNVAVALVQVFTPDFADGDWIAHSGIAGRAVGNLRQPNHLSSVLLWSAIAVVALVELRRIGRVAAAALFAAIVFAVVLTASRTGLVSVALLAVWGLLDHRLARLTRTLLIGAPLVYAVGWLGMNEWAQLSQHTFGGSERLAETDISGSRFGIWSNTLALIRAQPWTGVGFGEFNLAWTMTPFPGRPTAFFDHAHNLPLQLAVEIGLPLATLVIGLLTFALWRAGRLAFTGAGDLSASRRCAFMMVVMIGWHSLLEYPLWYTYFLLPAAWACGFAAAATAPETTVRADAPASRGLVGCGVALVAAGVLSTLDYRSVSAVFNIVEGAPSLERRIERGQRSVLFAHHADYAAATIDTPIGGLQPFVRATHFLLDTRLMMAWAKALEKEGRTDEARFVADRLREFHNANSEDFFDECDDPASSAGFQCKPAERTPGWREMVPP